MACQVGARSVPGVRKSREKPARLGSKERWHGSRLAQGVQLNVLLEKHFSGVVLGFIAIAAYFQASGASRLLGERWAREETLGARLQAASLLGLPATPRANADAIIARNPFDSLTGPLLAPLTPLPKLRSAGNRDPLAVPLCEDLRVSIVSESPDLHGSMAALQAPGEPRPHVHRIGDEVAGKRVEFIGFNPHEGSPAVWLSTSTTLCQVLLFRDPTLVSSSSSVLATDSAAASAASGGPALPPDIASKIQKLSDTEYDIDRSVLDRVLENSQALLPNARFVPEAKDGVVLGVRVFGVRPGSLFALLGMHNGDRLDSINGYNVGDPEKALQAYAHLRAASLLDLSLNRQGRPLRMTIHVK